MGCTVAIMAAQRAGTVDPLAARAGVSHKCLVPVAGKPMIALVVDAVEQASGVDRIRIVIEPGTADAALAAIGPRQVPVDWVASADNLADSVYAAAQGIEPPIIVTTADNVLLTPATVEAMAAAIAGGADAAVGLSTRGAVLAAHPQGQRRFYEFKDDAYSNCNIYALGGGKALRAAETFRSGGQFVKVKSRMVKAFGLLNVLMLRYRIITLPTALRRISRRLGLTLVPVVLADGSQAIDVDNERSFAIAGELLAKRGVR